eukprot:778292-Rhodomonas_salina.1
MEDMAPRLPHPLSEDLMKEVSGSLLRGFVLQHKSWFALRVVAVVESWLGRCPFFLTGQWVPGGNSAAG